MARFAFEVRLLLVAIYIISSLTACGGGDGGGGDSGPSAPPITKVNLGSSASAVNLNEGQLASIVVMLNQPTEVNVTVSFLILSGADDFAAEQGQIIIPAGQSSGNFTISASNDALIESTENFLMTVSSDSPYVEGSLTIDIAVTNTTTPALLTISDGPAYDFGVRSAGDVTEKVFTITNNGTGHALNVAATGLSAPITFKGGSFPGSGGTCSSTINGSQSCTIIVSYTDLNEVVSTKNLSLNYFSGVGNQMLPLELTGQSVVVQAAITNAPDARSSQVNLAVDIGGSNIISYKYKVGPATSTNCQASADYSGETPINTQITEDVSALADVNLKLCVVGKHSMNVWQGYLIASSYIWRKDTTPPVITGLLNDSVWRQQKAFSWACVADDICTYRYLIDQVADTTFTIEPYGAGNLASQNTGTGVYYLHIQAQDAVGLESAVSHIEFRLDNTAPIASPSIDDKDFFNSINATPNITWTESLDSHSGVADYQIAIGTAIGEQDKVPWTSLNSTALSKVLSSLVLDGDSYYFASIRSIDAAGNISAPTNGDGWMTDITPPSAPMLVDDGFMNPSLTSASVTWSAGNDGQSGVASYQIAIGTTQGDGDVVPWTDVGYVMNIIQPATLSRGGTYYASIRTVDYAGNFSNRQSGDGWIALGQFNQSQRLVYEVAPTGMRTANEQAYLGQSIAISEDGLTMVSGANLEDLDASGGDFKENAGAVFVYFKSGGTWSLQQKLVASGTNARMAADDFGRSVSISGDTIAVGTPNQDYDSSGGAASTNAGAVYIFTRTGSVWNQEAKITPSGLNARLGGDNFGISVSLSGNSLAVGAHLQDYDGSGAAAVTDAGAVFVYTRSGSIWSQQTKIVPSGTNARVSTDYFGFSVSHDADSLIVGAYGQDYDSVGGGSAIANAGAAFVYTRSGSTWSQQAKLTAPNITNERVSGDQFGYAVAISGDQAVIGANQQDFDAASAGTNIANAGAAYVFERVVTSWSQISKLTAQFQTPGRVTSDNFGSSVAISGNRILVGAPNQDTNASGASASTDAGAAYIFSKSTVWSYEAKLVGSGTQGRGASDNLGFAVALAGSTAAVSVPKQDFDDSGLIKSVDAGAAYIFNLSGSWSQGARLTDTTIPNAIRSGAVNAQMGHSVAISEDESTMVVGLNYDNLDSENTNYANNAGSVLVYKKQSGQWVLEQKISALGLLARNENDEFGFSVSISGDTIAVGAYAHDYDAAGANYISNAGAVYIFTRSSGVWSQQAKIIPTGTAARISNDQFGYSVSVSGDLLIVGANGQDTDASGLNSVSGAGAAFIFERSGTNWNQISKIVPTLGGGRFANDAFGFAVSAYGDTIAVSAPTHDYNSAGASLAADAGAVYTFKKIDGVWTASQKIVGIGTNNRIAGDQFGYSISLDQNRLLVGAPYQDYDSNGANIVSNTGAGYVFSRSSFAGNFLQEQKLSAAGSNARVADDNTGFSVGISGDLAILGSPNQDTNETGASSLSAGGAGFVFMRSAGMWTNPQKVVGFGLNSRMTSDNFGRAVAISNNSLAMGARTQDYDSAGANYIPATGAVFTFSF
jgi:hypothetical protein